MPHISQKRQQGIDKEDAGSGDRQANHYFLRGQDAKRVDKAKQEDTRVGVLGRREDGADIYILPGKS
jgi:hypothetical protein